MENIIRFLKKPEHTEEEKEISRLAKEKKHTELEIETFNTAVDLFKKDLKFIIRNFDSAAIENKNLEEKPNVKRSLYFRGLLHSYKEDESSASLPIVLMRPIETEIKDDDYFYESGIKMFHEYIYEKWVEIAKNKPDSPRAKILEQAEKCGGYESLKNIAFRIDEDFEGKITIIFNSTFSEEDIKKMGEKEIKELTEQLPKYEFNEISHYENIEEVETMILEDMLQEKIERDTEKLGTILTPRARLQYKRLAFKFLTIPNPDKTSKAYEIFQRYQKLLEKL